MTNTVELSVAIDDLGKLLVTPVIPLNASEIQHLSSSPVQLVAPQGANKVIFPVMVVISYTFGSKPFAAPVSTPQVNLTIAGDGVFTFQSGAQIFRGPASSFVMQSGNSPSVLLSNAANYADKGLFISAPGDLNGAGIATSSLGPGGSGYIGGDIFGLDTGDAAGVIDTVDGNGAITSYHLTDGGTVYVAPSAHNIFNHGDGVAELNVLTTNGGGDGSAKVTVSYIILDLTL